MSPRHFHMSKSNDYTYARSLTTRPSALTTPPTTTPYLLRSMGLLSRKVTARPQSLLPRLASLALFCLLITFVFKVEDYASQTRTVAGHNLKPTPWHLFTPKNFDDNSRYARASKIIQCSYLTCPYGTTAAAKHRSRSPTPTCPEFFRWIHRDLDPWARTRISEAHVAEARRLAAFRVLIVKGRVYVDYYYACVQSRALFTIWGLVQLLRRYPGMVPDVDLMFDCMDKPTVRRSEHGGAMPPPLPPLFRYCTAADHLDIPFPDWSFWGWPEVNVGPWDEEFADIKRGSQDLNWTQKRPHAYWKGNPYVLSPVRTELLRCNDTSLWGAEIMRQDWAKEAQEGYEQSKLSNQCKHRYKIYAEGYAWSVSLKYILSCGSLALIISPQYEDFFSRGLIPQYNYWPISPTNMCRSIKFAVDWGNSQASKAEGIGKGGQALMEDLSMDRVYDYMYHLVVQYSKLLDYSPEPPSTAVEVCGDSLLCFAEPKEREFLERSGSSPSEAPPCTLHPADGELIDSWIGQRRKRTRDVSILERQKKHE